MACNNNDPQMQDFVESEFLGEQVRTKINYLLHSVNKAQNNSVTSHDASIYKQNYNWKLTYISKQASS